MSNTENTNTDKASNNWAVPLILLVVSVIVIIATFYDSDAESLLADSSTTEAGTVAAEPATAPGEENLAAANIELPVAKPASAPNVSAVDEKTETAIAEITAPENDAKADTLADTPDGTNNKPDPEQEQVAHASDQASDQTSTQVAETENTAPAKPEKDTVASTDTNAAPASQEFATSSSSATEDAAADSDSPASTMSPVTPEQHYLAMEQHRLAFEQAQQALFKARQAAIQHYRQQMAKQVEARRAIFMQDALKYTDRQEQLEKIDQRVQQLQEQLEQAMRQPLMNSAEPATLSSSAVEHM
jgi:hypothetical protein